MSKAFRNGAVAGFAIVACVSALRERKRAKEEARHEANRLSRMKPEERERYLRGDR